jgi:hypothetical protein
LNQTYSRKEKTDKRERGWGKGREKRGREGENIRETKRKKKKEEKVKEEEVRREKTGKWRKKKVKREIIVLYYLENFKYFRQNFHMCNLHCYFYRN